MKNKTKTKDKKQKTKQNKTNKQKQSNKKKTHKRKTKKEMPQDWNRWADTDKHILLPRGHTFYIKEFEDKKQLKQTSREKNPFWDFPC